MNEWKGCEGCNVTFSDCLKAKSRLRCSLMREQAEAELREKDNKINRLSKIVMDEIGVNLMDN